MIKWFLTFVDCPTAQSIRIVALLSLSFFIGIISLSSVYAERADPQDNGAISIEHRFSVLETKVSQIGDDMADFRWKSWLELLGISGLVGETGLRVIKSKKKDV